MENNKNVKALSVGLLLILAIAAVTVLRSQFHAAPASDIVSAPDRSKQDMDSIHNLTAEKLSEKLKSQALTIIDIRSKSDFENSHILDSINLTLDGLQTKIPTLDKNKTYVIMDGGDGSGTFFINNAFPENNFKDYFYLVGGFPAWVEQALPTISKGDPDSFVDQTKVNYLKSEQLKSLMENERDLAIIDLRSQENYRSGHIPSAQNIYFEELESQRKRIPLGKKIILYDKDGLWAFQASVKLFDMGFFNVFCLADGLNGWQKKNFPITK